MTVRSKPVRFFIFPYILLIFKRFYGCAVTAHFSLLGFLLITVQQPFINLVQIIQLDEKYFETFRLRGNKQYVSCYVL